MNKKHESILKHVQDLKTKNADVIKYTKEIDETIGLLEDAVSKMKQSDLSFVSLLSPCYKCTLGIYS